ncbi:MAG: hypothetical protein K8W52_19475 [Deltaproteobacteria bacterium]|nr:hypothetical protein [Deltaproteobacteria bacterium]
MRRLRFALPFVMTYATNAACAHRVGQDAHTGPDGDPEGAEVMTFAGGTARTRGTVTYPGGDRVDWKRLDIDGWGTLDLELRWSSPQPDTVLGFEVYDQDGDLVARTETRERDAAADRHRATVVGLDARGTHFVDVFAPTRADAAAYELVVRLTPMPPPLTSTFEVPFPPPLPAVPPPPGAAGPAAPTPRCANGSLGPHCPSPPLCPGPTCSPPRALAAKVVGLTIVGSSAIATLDRGADDGVDMTWTVRYPSDPELVCTLVQVNRQRSTCRIAANVEDRLESFELVPP